MLQLYPYYLAGEPQFGEARLTVRDKYSGEPVAEVCKAAPADIDAAIAAAVKAAPAMRALPPFRRAEVLEHCVRRFTERAEELAQALCVEAGKPIRDARGEVTRLIDTFRIAAGEATRIGGEVMPLDVTPRAAGYFGMWRRVPVGPCAFITPFNFPLNLVAHKVAPAIAAGCPFVLKPASLTPIGAIFVAQTLAETDLPAGAFSVLPCAREDASAFVTDPRIKLLSFTGSQDVGWELKGRAGKKKVALELGGNAAVIVDSDADLADAVGRIIFGAFYQSGQSCVSVQRIIAHRDIYDELKAMLVERTLALKVGDPRDEATFIGPMITEKEAVRVQNWVGMAVEAGARLLCGAQRSGVMLTPALLEDVPTDQTIYWREVFGPVALLQRFGEFDEAIEMVNDSDYGLQAGVFTRDIFKAHKAWDRIETGGVIVNDVPSWRVDCMPYGGVKDSGTGREGVRFAIEEMTEMKLFVLRRV